MPGKCVYLYNVRKSAIFKVLRLKKAYRPKDIKCQFSDKLARMATKKMSSSVLKGD